MIKGGRNAGKGSDQGPVPGVRLGSASATLVNGVFGDPLLRLELIHGRRSLLFDLGDPGRMSARAAHQVSDVFISHAHADHIGGFLWFLRCRIGDLPPCRFYGPPGLAGQISGMVSGIQWDRAEDRAPRFEIREYYGDHLRCYQVVAGEGPARLLDELPIVDHTIWRESAFCVRTTQLDHHTPVLAYAWEPSQQLKVRRERLEKLGLKRGRWLQTLKAAVLDGRSDEIIAVPASGEFTAGQLADKILLVEAGKKLVYATDLADSADNRARLTTLARGAHSLFCEAPFMLADIEQARRTGHLTTRACAEIAEAAGVGKLLPFHFSRRYYNKLTEVYAEIGRFTQRLVLPS